LHHNWSLGQVTIFADLLLEQQNYEQLQAGLEVSLRLAKNVEKRLNESLRVGTTNSGRGAHFDRPKSHNKGETNNKVSELSYPKCSPWALSILIGQNSFEFCGEY
jgi:hypothetical protein